MIATRHITAPFEPVPSFHIAVPSGLSKNKGASPGLPRDLFE
jgi:hypothetical protein